MSRFMKAYNDHREAAEKAEKLFRAMCDYKVPRVPGMDTVIRLAWRIECGHTPETAAVREYIYRINLSLISWRCFGAPCLLGQ